MREKLSDKLTFISSENSLYSMTDEAPSKKCLAAMYNLTIAMNSRDEAEMELRATTDIGEFADSLLTMNVASQLIEYWGEKVEAECQVEWDEDVVEQIMKKEQERMIPYVREILEQGLTYDPEFAKKQAERAEKDEKEAEGVLYG